MALPVTAARGLGVPSLYVSPSPFELYELEHVRNAVGEGHHRRMLVFPWISKQVVGISFSVLFCCPIPFSSQPDAWRAALEPLALASSLPQAALESFKN